ncbi:hypothetical protein [Streptosporangium sp. NPDC004631]
MSRLSISRFMPTPEALNLFVGVLSATAINLLTSAVQDDVRRDRVSEVLGCGSFMLAGAVVLGGIAVVLTQVRDEVLSGIPMSISPAERRALLRQAIDAKGAGIPVACTASLLLLTASAFSVLLF